MLTLSLLMFLSASNNFWASARLEVFEKEYVKKELEPGNREARETPAENLTE